jgi:mutual gliding-motility protein MglA
MAMFNLAKREIDLKIVYCGPGMCGKTTNLQRIHKMLGPQQRGELVSLPTKDDRTLFFDFLLMERYISGFKTRFHLYTVPGQVQYALTRRAVLMGVDGVVFVVDSQTDKLQENIASLKDLGEHLHFYKKDLSAFPCVLQYNKRDLPTIMPVDELDATFNRKNIPAFESIAVTGKGVAATLNAICNIVQKNMEDDTAKKKR